MHVLPQVIADKNDGVLCLCSRVYQEEGKDEIDLWLKVIPDKSDCVSCLSSHVYQEEGDDQIDLCLNYGLSRLSSNDDVCNNEMHLRLKVIVGKK